jgi:hypothetical protein
VGEILRELVSDQNVADLVEQLGTNDEVDACVFPRQQRPLGRSSRLDGR